MIWALIIWALKFLHAFSLAFMLSAQLIINPDRNNPRSPGFDMAYLITRPYGYIVDFLNMVTLLYLFYCLGKSAEINESQDVS